MKKINIEIKLVFYKEFFVGGGKGTGDIDNLMLKDRNEMPFIPGSIIKGKLRHYCSIFAQSISETGNNLLICNKSKDYCNHGKDPDENCDCSICRIFGSTGNTRGLLSFDNGMLDRYEEKGGFAVRNGIEINRFTKSVKKSALYKMQTFDGGVTIKADIEGYLPEETYQRDLFLIGAGFSMIETLGGSRSRGLGFIDKKRSSLKIYIDKKKTDCADNVAYDWKEGEKHCATI